MIAYDLMWAFVVGLLAGGVQLLTFAVLNVRTGRKWNDGL